MRLRSRAVEDSALALALIFTTNLKVGAQTMSGSGIVGLFAGGLLWSLACQAQTVDLRVPSPADSNSPMTRQPFNV